MNILLLSFLGLVKYVVTTNVFQCNSRKEENLHKRVNIYSEFGDCKQSPCHVSLDMPFHLEYYFTATSTVNELRVKTRARYFRNKRSMPDDEENLSVEYDQHGMVNVCNTTYNNDDFTKGCPIKSGIVHVYRAQLRVRSQPKDIMMELALYDDKRKMITCFDVDLRVKNKKD